MAEPITQHPVVEVRGISKRFGSVRANDNVALALRAGEIHAVLGENGAGKTTLMNILSGIYHPDAGEIEIGGEPVTIASPADALRRGIGTVYQHFTLVPNLSVVENAVLGMEGGFVLDLGDAERRLGGMLADFGLAASPRTEVRHLALGERQRVEIVKVLFRGSRVLLLDEPTSVLTPVEVDGLFAILLRLKAEGVAVVLITHKLEEALAISDRVTVLRQGRKVGELNPGDLSDHPAARARIVEWMFGGTTERPPNPPGPPSPQSLGGRREDAALITGPPYLVPEGLREVSPRFQPGVSATDSALDARRPSTADPPILLSLQAVSARGDRGHVAVDGVSLELRAGEIVGIAGVDGNGQKELGEIIAGQRRVTAGRVLLGGREMTNAGVAAAARAGVGYVTDDRLGEGCVPGASVAENAVLKTVGRKPFSNGFWLDRRAIDAQARDLIERFDVRTPGTSTGITLLSGGNIQKLLLARELAMDPTVLVCNKPTTGLDLRTAAFVGRTLREQADAGKAVLLISSELDEILAISDRIGVMFAGRLVALFPRAAADPETIGHLMLGGTTDGETERRRDGNGPHPRPLSPPRERGDEGAGTKPPLPRTGEGVGGEGGEGRGGGAP